MEEPDLEERLRVDHYITADGLWVFTERAHIERGSCCGSGCKYCPFEPRGVKGNQRLQEAIAAKAVHGK